jgi:hypothetical protein
MRVGARTATEDKLIMTCESYAGLGTALLDHTGSNDLFSSFALGGIVRRSQRIKTRPVRTLNQHS